MKKLVIISLILSLTVLTLTACGNKASDNNTTPTSQTTAKEKLKVALDAQYKPMEWEENGQITGFDADLIKAIAKEMGREVELKNVVWDEIFDKLYAGEYNTIISSVTINDKRKETMLFSNPYYDSIPLILTRKDSGIKNANDLSKKKVAVQDGTTAHELISSNIAGVQIEKCADGPEAFAKFANKSVAAVVLDAPVVLDYVKQNNDPNYNTIEDKNFFPAEQFGIAVNKTDQALINEINTALDKVKANGEYQKIYDKYFKTK